MKNIVLIISLCIHIVFFILTNTHAKETVVVGIYENMPLCFSEKSNHAQGIYIDVLNDIATVHSWHLHYKIYRWNDCIKALKSHEIDLMCGIAATPDRKNTYCFNQENVMLDWGQIYLPKKSRIQSILDLDNKRIATVRGGILQSRFQKLANDFDISCQFVLVESAQEVLKQIETNQVDAGTVLRLFGMRFSSQLYIKPSPIIFSPLHLRFATANPNKTYLLEMIDSQLIFLKSSEGSNYYKTLDRWLIHPKSKWFLPKWLYWLLCGFLVLLIFLLTTSIFLKYQITQRTLQLNQQNITLKKNEHLLRTIAENYPHSYVSIIENDMTISFTSGQEFQRMNHSPNNYIGKHVRDIFGKYADFIIQQYQKTFSGESLSFEMFHMDQYQLYRTVPLIEKDTSIPRILVVIENITRQKKMAKEKEQLENQLRQAQKMEAIGTLAGGIAHDFNNILAIILGNIELCLDDTDPMDPIHMSMNEAQIACIRARDLIRQILNFSRKTYPNKEPLIITSIIKESARLIRASVPANIMIDTDIPDLEETVLGNPTQINQVLLNLCANAVYAMGDEGTLKINVSRIIPQKIPSLINALEKKPYVKISVHDNGSGISEGVINKIFDPYFTTKKVGDGSGMGLSLVYSIVQAHKGAITVESIPEKGTTFVIYLPIIQHKLREKLDPLKPIPKGAGNILFVDDEEMLVRVGKRMLTQLGYTVTGYHTPMDAFSEFESRPNKYDLVISDMTMPGMSGKILSQKILSIRSDIPIIICSGYSESMDESFCKKMGIRHFLLKPLSIRILAEKVYSLLMTS
jgi:signal transduction histidine kinase/ABC-type amino acid transport substrate-binding protein